MLLPAIPYFFGAAATVDACPGMPYWGCSGKTAVFQVGSEAQPPSAKATKVHATRFLILWVLSLWMIGWSARDHGLVQQ
jgi:hypothetical protein